MPSTLRGAHLRLRITTLAVAGMLCLSFTAPVSPVAAQDVAAPLSVGAPAQIIYGNGQDVLLRAAPGYDAEVLAGYPDGTPVDLIEGPLTASDGSIWFGAVVYGQQGYLAADFLTTPGGTAPQTVADVTPEQTAAPEQALAPEQAAAPEQAWTPEQGATGDQAAAPAADGLQEVTAAQPAAAPAAVPGEGYATTDLNLRAGPSFDDAVMLVIPGGAALSTTGEASNGFLGVVYNGQVGWADAAYVGAGTPYVDPALATTTEQPAAYTGDGLQEVTAAQPAAAPVVTDTSGLVTDPTAAPAGTAASVNALVNLRGGPSEADAVLRVLPVGSPITITGAETNGFVPVWYNGTSGWIATPFIDSSGLTMLTAEQPATVPGAAPAAAPTEPVAPTGTVRQTLEAVNLRAEPAVASQVIGSIPAGVALTPLAGPESGFYQVTYNGVTGWVSGAYLGDTGQATDATQPASAFTPDPGLQPAAGGSGLIWPVTGGSWTIMQGYNGSSHQDRSSNWQYYYSLDLVRSDGNTAGQLVVAPTAGTVRWLDPSTGGISIDIGNGHAIAMFHVSVDPGLRDGTPVQQGQAIGHISGPGEPGFAGTPHLHLALWQTSDGGNWSRDAVPFTGAYALGGREFPDIGGSNQHRGTEIVL